MALRRMIGTFSPSSSTVGRPNRWILRFATGVSLSQPTTAIIITENEWPCKAASTMLTFMLRRSGDVLRTVKSRARSDALSDWNRRLRGRKDRRSIPGGRQMKRRLRQGVMALVLIAVLWGAAASGASPLQPLFAEVERRANPMQIIGHLGGPTLAVAAKGTTPTSATALSLP